MALMYLILSGEDHTKGSQSGVELIEKEVDVSRQKQETVRLEDMCQLKPQKLDLANISEVEMSALDPDSHGSRPARSLKSVLVLLVQNVGPFGPP